LTGLVSRSGSLANDVGPDRLAGIARYKWIDRLRALDRDPATPCAEDISEDIAIDARPCDRERAPASQALSRLKPAQSEVIRLVKLKGLSVQKASEVTGQCSATS
jgi:DNA-directed RNA polymerase specialized sigma24 family protein